MFLGCLSGVVFLSMFYGVVGQRRLYQDAISLTKNPQKTAYISCRATGLSSGDYIHWYQRKEGEAFKRIFYINQDGTNLTPDSTFPEKDHFSAEKRENVHRLYISNLDPVHSATYYCACWDRDSGYWFKIFGSGTKLVVTDNSPEEPKLFAFTPSKPQNQKVTLLCLATDMFPNVVRFKWKRDGKELPGADFEQLDQREDKQTSSMIIIDEAREKDKYSCSVEHETNKEKQPVEVEIPNKVSNPEPDPSCVPLNTNGTGETQVTMANFGVMRSLYLGTLIYSLLLAKSVMYFGIVSILICKWPGGPVKGRKLP